MLVGAYMGSGVDRDREGVVERVCVSWVMCGEGV